MVYGQGQATALDWHTKGKQCKSLNDLRGLTVGLSWVGTALAPTCEGTWGRMLEAQLNSHRQEAGLSTGAGFQLLGRGWKLTFSIAVRLI